MVHVARVTLIQHVLVGALGACSALAGFYGIDRLLKRSAP